MELQTINIYTKVDKKKIERILERALNFNQ